MMYTALLLTLVCVSCVQTEHHDPALESVVGGVLLEAQDRIKAIVAHSAGTEEEQATSLIDGDELLTSVGMAEAILQDLDGGSRRKRTLYNFGMYPENRWPSDTIPYIFGYDFSDDQKATIRVTLAEWSSRTCVAFAETPSDDPSLPTTPHLSFTQGTDCISFVSHGENDKPQSIFLRDSCFNIPGEITHVIGHALGLWHEHQRPDRDDFLTVQTENIQTDEQGNFLVLPDFIIDDLGHPYDYGSITHFQATQYTKNSEYTMVPTDPLYTATIGQRVLPSFWDIQKINTGYCNDTCTGIALAVPCLNQGYQDPTDCTRCRCPDGYGGQFCQTLAAGVGASCGGEYQLEEGDELTIESPNYGGTGRYAINTECTWRITAPEGRQIRMWFDEIFEVFCRREVAYHWVEIRYKDMVITGPRFCGTSRPMVELLSELSEVMVIFKANYDNENPDDPSTAPGQRRGFRLHLDLMNCGGCGMQAGGVQAPCDSKTDMDTIETTCYRYVTRRTHRGSWWFRHTVTVTLLESYACTEYIPVQYCCEGAELCRKTTGEYVCIKSGWMDWCDCTASCGNCGAQWRKCWAYSRCLPFQIGFESRLCDPAPCTDCENETRCETPCCYGNVLNDDGDMCIAG